MRRERFDRFEELAAFDDRRFDDFRETFADRAIGQRLERVDMREDRDRIGERAGDVFPGLHIDAGLAADRRIDHRDERGRDVHVGHAAHVRRRA